MNGPDRYTYRVIWSDEDQMYVGLCAEFGLLSHLDDTPEGAFAGIRDVAKFAVNTLHKDGDPSGGTRPDSLMPDAGRTVPGCPETLVVVGAASSVSNPR